MSKGIKLERHEFMGEDKVTVHKCTQMSCVEQYKRGSHFPGSGFLGEDCFYPGLGWG